MRNAFYDRRKESETVKRLLSVQTDLKLAKSLAYTAGGEPKLDALQSEYNQAAYHSLQAIEKSMKLVLAANGEQYEKTHSVALLMVGIDEKYQQDFIDTHPFLWKNRKQLTTLNGARYDDIEATQMLVFVLYKEAESLSKEITEKFKETARISDQQIEILQKNITADRTKVPTMDLLVSEHYIPPSQRTSPSQNKPHKFDYTDD